MSLLKQPAASSTDTRTLAVFNSLPVADYQTLETALMSIISNRFEPDQVVLIEHAEDPKTLDFVRQVATTYSLKLHACEDRDKVLTTMTDALVFCSVSDSTLFKELAPRRDQGVTMYFVVQE